MILLNLLGACCVYASIVFRASVGVYVHCLEDAETGLAVGVLRRFVG
jgi:hypothetical protein